MNHTEEKDYILSVLAQNHAGVLLRIAGLFSRRCYNIKSIVAAQTEDNNRSRILIMHPFFMLVRSCSLAGSGIF